MRRVTRLGAFSTNQIKLDGHDKLNIKQSSDDEIKLNQMILMTLNIKLWIINEFNSKPNIYRSTCGRTIERENNLPSNILVSVHDEFQFCIYTKKNLYPKIVVCDAVTKFPEK